MASLSDLRRYVHEELEDYEAHVEPESINRTLNRGQDLFTRDSGYLRGVNVQDITAGTARYTLSPASGYRIGRVMAVQFHDGNGAVSTITISNAGSSYTSAPTVTIADPSSGTTATATATVSGGEVTAITISEAGTGYLGPPAITFSGGGGSGAAAFCTLAGIDDDPLESMSVDDMLKGHNANWRFETSGRPTHYLRNYDDGTADTARNESIRLYPVPTTSYTVGLRVSYTLVTDGQMSGDQIESALPERVALEALVSYACAEVLFRKASRDPDAAKVLIGAAKRYQDRWKDELDLAVREVSGGYDRKKRVSRGHYV